MEDIAFINNSRTAWPAKILMQFLSFSDNLLQDVQVDNFEILH